MAARSRAGSGKTPNARGANARGAGAKRAGAKTSSAKTSSARGMGASGKGASGRGAGGRGAGGRGAGSATARSAGPKPAWQSGRRGAPGGQGQRGSTPVRDQQKARSLGGEQVEGRHAVRELLLAGARRTREVIMAADLDEADILDDIIDLADENKVPIRQIGRNRFESMARTDAPQGVLAFAAPLREYDIDTLAKPRNGRPPFLLLLDGVTDPGNLGALLRTAECAGVTGVILPRHRAAHVTPSVTKSAAGAIEHLRMATVPGLPTAIAALSKAGVWTVGLDAAADRSLFELELADQPVALVLGAEGTGLSRLVRERCDMIVSIPLRGHLNSLNVSVAGALACFEVTRRRELPGSAP